MSLTEAASIVSKRYPPRGGIHLLEAQHTHPDALDIEKIIVEEYILDTLFIYRNSRVDCVQRIARDIPSPFPIFPLVAQTLFSQLLLLPRPPLQPVTYAAVIINLCKVGEDAWSVFPRGLSACVREVFARMSVLDPELMDRTADWLSLHLSNLGFMWPWTKWKKVIDAPAHNAQRLFVQRVLQGLVDLSYLTLVQNNLSPVEFHALLPSEPVAKPFGEMFKASELPQERTEDEMEVDSEREKQEDMPGFPKLHRLGEMITSKEPAEVVQQAFEEDLSAPPEQAASFMKGFCRVMLLCGDKNVTHTSTMLTRYRPILETLMHSVGEQSEEIWIDAVTDVWSASLQRTALILTLLMEREMLRPTTLVQWALQRIQENISQEDHSKAQLWEVVHCGLKFAEACVKDAENERTDAGVKLHHAREAAQDAAVRAAEAAERLESGATDNAQEMIDAINEANEAEERARQEVAEAEAHLQTADADGMNDALDHFQTVFLTVPHSSTFPQVVSSGSRSLRDIFSC